MNGEFNKSAHVIRVSQEDQGLRLVSTIKTGQEFYSQEYYKKLKRSEMSLQG